MSLADFDRMTPEERDLRLEKYDRQRATCPDCGNPIEECSDPDRVWYSYRRICNASMERAGAEALYADLHEKLQFHDGTFTDWSEKRTRTHPFKYDDGVRIGVADHDLMPWDKFTTDPEASPLPPSDDAGADEVPDGAGTD